MNKQFHKIWVAANFKTSQLWIPTTAKAPTADALEIVASISATTAKVKARHFTWRRWTFKPWSQCHPTSAIMVTRIQLTNKKKHQHITRIQLTNKKKHQHINYWNSAIMVILNINKVIIGITLLLALWWCQWSQVAYLCRTAAHGIGLEVAQICDPKANGGEQISIDQCIQVC